MYFIKIIKKYFNKKWENNISPVPDLHYHDCNYFKYKKNIYYSSLTKNYTSIVYKTCQEKTKYNT